MTFKFSLVSDLHVDFPQPKIPPLEKNVIVAGDTSNGLVGLRYLAKLKMKGHQVFAVDGNHEHYTNQSQGRTIRETEGQFYSLLDQNCKVEVQPGLTILGCNGWYPVESNYLWRGSMNDHRVGTQADVNTQYLLHANWLAAELRALEGRAIVVTHTAPCLETLNPAYDGHYSNQWYWSPLMNQTMIRFADKIAVWCHGHTHAPADKIIHGVRVVCNPRGYPGENPGWAPMTLEI